MNLNPNSTFDFRSNDSAETWKVKMQERESEDEMQRDWSDTVYWWTQIAKSPDAFIHSLV